MKLRNQLHSIEHSYHVELWQTYKLTEDTYDQLIGRMEKSTLERRADALDDQQRKQFKTDLQAYISKRKRVQELSGLALDYVAAAANDFWLEKRLANLTDMALIYVVTLMEAFIKEYLTQLYCKKPILLKSSKTITYEEIIALDKMPRVHTLLAEKEVEQVSYKSIDQLAEYLNAKLRLGIDDNCLWWPLCKEASYRRNIIVHNRGVVNSQYVSKETEAPPAGTKLGVSISYLEERTKAIKDFVKYTHETIIDKLRIR